MNYISELPVVCLSPRRTLARNQSRSLWQYRFCSTDKLRSQAREILIQKWTVLSFSLRHDSQREYLLRRRLR
jgi:hypothetical protein